MYYLIGTSSISFIKIDYTFYYTQNIKDPEIKPREVYYNVSSNKNPTLFSGLEDAEKALEEIKQYKDEINFVNNDFLAVLDGDNSKLNLDDLKIFEWTPKEVGKSDDNEKLLKDIETRLLNKICIGCGYLKNNECTYKGANCGVSKPAYEMVKEVFAEIRQEK